jgi:phage-related protein
MATLSFIIDAQNKAGQAIKEVESQVKGLEGKVKDMQPAFQKMALVGTAAFAGVAAASWKAIEAYMAQERAEQRLFHLTEQTVGATKEQTQALLDQASALQRVGVVGDEVTIFGQSQLATFALQTQSIKELTPALLDLAVANYGVNVSQDQMINLGNLMGKVLTGQTSALTRYGVTFSEVQEEVLKTGTELERASMLAEVLGQNFGGLNEAMAETAEGGLQQAKNEIGDLWEQIGKSLIPIVKDLTDTLLPVIKKTVEWASENPTLVRNIIIATGAIAGIIAVVGTLGLLLPILVTGFGALGTVMGIILSPIGLVIAIIAALGVAGYALYKNWDSVVGWIKDVWGSLTGFFDGIFQSIQETFSRSISFLMRTLQPFINAFETVKSAASWIGSQAGGAISGATNFLGGLLGGGQFGIDNVPRTGMYMLHRGEQVVPAGASSGGGITVNINGGYYLSEQVAEDLGDKIIDQLKRQMKI